MLTCPARRGLTLQLKGEETGFHIALSVLSWSVSAQTNQFISPTETEEFSPSNHALYTLLTPVDMVM